VGAPKIQADYDGLREIAIHFAAKAQDTNNLLQTIDRCVDELRRGAWIGKGADQFYAEMQQEISPAMLRLRNALDDASSATTRIAQALERHEREAAALFYGGDGAIGAVSAGGVAAFAMNRILNFLNKLVRDGKDPRDGFTKALNTFASTAAGYLFEEASASLAKRSSETLKKLLSSTGGKVLVGLGSGILGGAVDIAFAYINGTPIDGNRVFDQLVSGGVQGLIGMTGVGSAVLLADAGIQILGHGAVELVSRNTEWLANDNAALAEAMRQTTDRLSLALDNFSAGNRLDGMVGAIRNGIQTGDLLGAVGGVATELGRFAIGGIGSTVVEGATLTLQVGAGLAARVGDAVGNLVSGAQTAVKNFFSFLW
jgi:WXG100 family type VII secretion target